jgi:hypothetical protein
LKDCCSLLPKEKSSWHCKKIPGPPARVGASGKKNPQFVEELSLRLTFVIYRDTFQSGGGQETSRSGHARPRYLFTSAFLSRSQRKAGRQKIRFRAMRYPKSLCNGKAIINSKPRKEQP